MFLCACVRADHLSIDYFSFEKGLNFIPFRIRWSSIKLEKILNCKANGLAATAIAFFCFFSSVRYRWTKSKRNDSNNAILSVYKLLYNTAVHCWHSRITFTANQIDCKQRARAGADKRLTTTIMSTHKIDPNYVTCFWNYVKGWHPLPFFLPLCRDSINEQNEGINETASPNAQTHSTHSFTRGTNLITDPKEIIHRTHISTHKLIYGSIEFLITIFHLTLGVCTAVVVTTRAYIFFMSDFNLLNFWRYLLSVWMQGAHINQT